jgi:hypothetical protein
LIHPEHGTLTIAPISEKYFLQLTYDDRGGGVGFSFCAPTACKRVLVPAQLGSGCARAASATRATPVNLFMATSSAAHPDRESLCQLRGYHCSEGHIHTKSLPLRSSLMKAHSSILCGAFAYTFTMDDHANRKAFRGQVSKSERPASTVRRQLRTMAKAPQYQNPRTIA